MSFLTFPGLNNRDGLVDVQALVVTLLLGEQTTAVREGNGPVDEVEVEVFKAELGKGVVEGGRHILGLVAVVPQLGGDEDVLTLQARHLSKGTLEALANLLLVLVDLGQIEMTVSGLEGLVDASADLTRGRLPGAVAKGGNLGAGVEGYGLSERHYSGDLRGVGRVVFEVCW